MKGQTQDTPKASREARHSKNKNEEAKTLSGPPLPPQRELKAERGKKMAGKKSTTTQPGDFSTDQFERRLAEGRAALRRSEEARDDSRREGRDDSLRELRKKFDRITATILARIETKGTDTVHRDKPRKSAKNKYAQFWNKRFEGLHPSQMRKTEKYLDKAGLTIAERDCYYLRVGYSKTFAEIASRMGYKHHSTAWEHFEKARAKVQDRNS